MMKRVILYITGLIVLSSCVEEQQFSNTARGNFEACWKIINDRYCFFEYKNVDWDEVYDRYEKKIESPMQVDSLFYLLSDMLCELKDGHVNIYSSFDVGRYWDWFEQYPENFDYSIQKNYLGTNYKIAGGMKYNMLDDDIGYIYYSTFEALPGEAALDNVLKYFDGCKGIIFDVRNNGGGSLSNVDKIVCRFIDEKILAGYIQHKTGKGHDDFSDLFAYYIDPSVRKKWFAPIAVLTNRHTYSAANNFVSVMKSLPQVKTFGDKTGGGCGMPFSSELPVGWSIRFSASPIYNADKELTEFGIDPDYPVAMTLSSIFTVGKTDEIIEAAKLWIYAQ